MIKKILSITLCCLLLTANTSFIYAQTGTSNNDKKIAKIKAKVIKLEKKNDKHAYVNLKSGKTLKGSISQQTDDSFTVTNKKTGQSTSVLYTDVDQIGGGFPTGAKIAFIVGAGAAAAIIIGLFAVRYCNEQAC